MNKRKDNIVCCIYSKGVECKPEGRKCDKCGWNPIVAEIRVTALKNGERRFLRYSNRDYDAVVPKGKLRNKV